MHKSIAVVPGDGIGPEVMRQAERVLEAVAAASGHTFELKQGVAGGAAYEHFGSHMPEETLALCRRSDAILFGSVGGPVSEQHLDKWKNCEANSILSLRKTFKFYANFRPVRLLPELAEMCPLRFELIKDGIDILFIRELLGDAYFGKKETTTENGRRVARDVSTYTEDEVAQVAHVAFKAARNRKKRVTSVDKANVLDASKLWRAVVHEVAKEYPDVELVDMLVDNCAMQIIRDPKQFDVVVTTNMFGDILTDEAAVLAGSLGLLASASINADGFALYEPSGGSAPDIAGQGIANPIAQILSVALMLRFSFELEKEARMIESAVDQTLKSGFRTRDIATKNAKILGTKEFTDEVLKNLQVPATTKGK
jgi:3-isopropylmalate dehydrogenase